MRSRLQVCFPNEIEFLLLRCSSVWQLQMKTLQSSQLHYAPVNPKTQFNLILFAVHGGSHLEMDFIPPNFKFIYPYHFDDIFGFYEK